MEHEYDPTPAEIADACARIREKWSADEYRRRATPTLERHRQPASGGYWTPPVVTTTRELVAALETRAR